MLSSLEIIMTNYLTILLDYNKLNCQLTSCEPQWLYLKLGQKFGCNIPFPFWFIILDELEIEMNIIKEHFKIGM